MSSVEPIYTSLSIPIHHPESTSCSAYLTRTAMKTMTVLSGLALLALLATALVLVSGSVSLLVFGSLVAAFVVGLVLVGLALCHVSALSKDHRRLVESEKKLEEHDREAKEQQLIHEAELLALQETIEMLKEDAAFGRECEEKVRSLEEELEKLNIKYEDAVAGCYSAADMISVLAKAYGDLVRKLLKGVEEASTFLEESRATLLMQKETVKDLIEQQHSSGQPDQDKLEKLMQELGFIEGDLQLVQESQQMWQTQKEQLLKAREKIVKKVADMGTDLQKVIG